MSVELADAYISLVIESSKIPRQVEKGLNSAQPNVDKAGKTMGSRLAGGIGAVFSTAAKGVGLAAGAVIGTALTQGMQRMVAIDDAKGKLAGLGHTAEGVAGIMDSALAAVKGTAFGLGDAATIAASAVAAGVAPGEQLTRYLSLTADAATIAGTSLSDMGSILNKVTTSGKAYTDDLNMLADRGIPVYQWLQKEYGVSADALSEMVKKGQVDAETFRKVIQDNIGGAALESGKTLRGAWENTKAALGRVGEAGLRPFLDMMKGGLGSATEWADKVAPKVEKVATSVATGLTDLGRAFQSNGASVDGTASIYEQFGIKARQVWDKLAGFGARVREAINAFRTGEDGSRIAAFWESLTGGAKTAGDTLQSVTRDGSTFRQTLSKLADAGKSVGESLVSLTGDTGVVAAGVIRGLGSAMSFLADHADKAGWAVAALVGTLATGQVTTIFYQWSRIANAIMQPAVIASTIAQTRAITQHTAAINTYLAARGIEVAQTPTTIRGRIAAAAASTREAIATRAAATSLAQYAAAQRLAMASSTGVAAGFHNTAAAAATLGSRVQGTATVAMSRLRSAASSVVGMMGGPWVAALAAAGLAVWKFNSDADAHRQRLDTVKNSWQELAKTQNDLRGILSMSNGQTTGESLSNITAQVTALNEAMQANADNRTDWYEWRALFQAPWGDGIKQENWTADRWAEATKAIDDLNMSDQALAETLASDAEWEALEQRLRAVGEGGNLAADNLQWVRDKINETRDAVKNSTPGFGTLTDAIRTLSDESATADDRVSAMKRALDALTGKPIDLGDAVQNLNQQLRDIEGIGEQWDPEQGFGAQELILPDGEINTKTENGDRLRTSFQDLRDAVLDVAQAGGDLGPVWAELDTKFEELAHSTGLETQQVKDLAETIGLVPSSIEVLAKVQGADQATQDLTAIKLLLDQNREKPSVEFSTELVGSPEVIAEIERAGGKVEEVSGKPGVFTVKAENIQQVIDQIDSIIAKKIPDKTVRLTVDQQALEPHLGPYAGLYTGVPGRATGGPGPVSGPVIGPGGPKSDSILTALSAGEHVLTAEEVRKAGGHGAIYRMREAIRQGVPFLRRAEGGPIGIERAIDAARSVEGNKYEWGGTGPNNFDCSGFVGWLQQIAMGIIGSTKRLYTTLSLLAGETAGLEPGLGPTGTYFQVGVSDAHMAATIDGHPVESGGAHGTSGIGGGRAGALHPDLPRKFHLPNALIDGWNGRSRARKNEWTESDQLELEDLQLDVTEAIERRDEVYADSDSTDTDRQRADLNVRKAQQKVIDKTAKRDGSNEDDPDRSAPEAPALARQFSEEEADRIDKLSAVEDARENRNKVYDDPDATDIDRLKADAEYSRALQEANQPADSESPTSIRGVVTKLGGELGGVLFDAFKAQLPDALSGSHWWNVGDEALAASAEADPAATSQAVSDALSGLPAFPADEVMSQLGFVPGNGIPDWAKNVKVYDSGGWLQPGEMGVNLSNKPEPIFNSPEQLRRFAGNLEPTNAGAGALTEKDVMRLLALRPAYTIQTSDVRGAMQEIRVDQMRQRAGFDLKR